MSDLPFDFTAERTTMIERHLKARDIKDAGVLRAMSRVPRHEFVPPNELEDSYADHPLPIGCGQTISQPYIVAYMTQLLRLEPGMKVLEIGTGSGYQTAILVEMGAKVVTIERHEPLVDHAVEVLEKLGYADNIDFRVDDGTVGVPEDAPYDRIIVTAAGPEIPEALERQLAENGRMVIPVGIGNQKLVIVTRSGDKIVRIPDIGVIFVKLIGKEGFSE